METLSRLLPKKLLHVCLGEGSRPGFVLFLFRSVYAGFLTGTGGNVSGCQLAPPQPLLVDTPNIAPYSTITQG